LIGAFVFHDKTYTFYNFLGGGLLLMFVLLIVKPKYLSKFFLSYLIALIPFLLINGVLTGGMIDEPIVWYNSAKILNIRIGTIPIEDTIYCLTMLLLTVLVYEFAKSKKV
jgi:lycopene cyclase domain-containing protein